MRNIIIDYTPDLDICKPMIIRNMPIDVYHKSKGISNSGLKTLIDCPAKYYYKYLSGEYEAKEKPHFKIGKACHCYILEGKETFFETYWHNPYANFDKAGLQAVLEKIGIKADKKFTKPDLMELLLSEKGVEKKEIELNSNELNQVISIGKSIFNNKYAKNAFSQKGESELSIFWQGKNGEWLKCRPDFLPYECKLVPDYKTCASVNPQTFYNDFLKYGYHIQAALYREGIKAVTGIDVESFFFICQEKEAPFITQVYLPDMHLIDFGEKAFKQGVEKFKECKEKGVWETYSDKIVELSLQIKPEDEPTNFNKEKGICFAPAWIDRALASYEV